MTSENPAEKTVPDGNPTPAFEGPVSLDQVKAAIEHLKEVSKKPTRRAVLHLLGRGSLRDVHAMMREIEATEEEEPLPAIDISKDEQRMVLHFGASVFSLMKERLRVTTEERERILASRTEQAEKRLEEVIEAAEAEVAAARADQQAAEAAKLEAEHVRDEMLAEAEAARKDAQRAAGQVSLLTTERDSMAGKLSATEERLTRAIAAQEAETEERTRGDERNAAQAIEIKNLALKAEGLTQRLQEIGADLADALQRARGKEEVLQITSQTLMEERRHHQETLRALGEANQARKVAEARLMDVERDASAASASLAIERTRAEVGEKTIVALREQLRGQNDMMKALDEMVRKIQPSEMAPPTTQTVNSLPGSKASPRRR